LPSDFLSLIPKDEFKTNHLKDPNLLGNLRTVAGYLS
jgi:hypothetical protein